MAAIEVGRICLVKAGRRKDEEVAITQVVDNNFVMAKTKKGKDRKFAVVHLNPTDKKA